MKVAIVLHLCFYMVTELNFPKLCSCFYKGPFITAEDRDGSESVAEKVNSRSFNLHFDYPK